MPFQRPTLTDLRKQVASDIEFQLQGGPLLRFSNEKITGDALAALAHLHYGYLDWVALQAVPFTATDEYLEGWAALKGITRKPATAATGSVTLNGTAGTIIPAGTTVVRNDGYEYTTNADATVGADGTATIAITAILPPLDPVTNPAGNGALGNADAGIALTLGTAIPGVQSNGTAAIALTGGADIETNDSLRSRMLQQYQSMPQGGAQNDYVSWALAVPGVSRAWCAPNGYGAGTVVVYVMLDNSESAHNGFPQGNNGVATDETRSVQVATGDQLAVANAIYPLQPVTALVYVCAPINNPINFTISGIAGVSSTTKAAIATAIRNVFLQYGAPSGTVDLSYFESAIAAVAGTTGFVITAPTGNIMNTTGELPTLGTITYA